MLLNPALLLPEAIISGLHLFLPFLLFLFAYLLWRLFTYLADWLLWHQHNERATAKLIIKFMTLLVVVLTLGLATIITIVNWVNIKANPVLLTYNNHLLMELDLKLFGHYVPFWLQASNNSLKPILDLLAPILINTYKGLSAALSLALLITLVHHYRQFYRLLLAIVLTVVFSLPLWLYLPALTPREAYWENILQVPIPLAIQTALDSYQPNVSLQNYFGYIKNIKPNNSAGPQTVTTIPSLHIAWGTLIVYFTITAWPILATVAVPYFLLNLLATMFTLQHYAVDTIAGVVVAILAIVVANLLIKKLAITADQPTIHMVIRSDLIMIQQALVKLRAKLFKKP